MRFTILFAAGTLLAATAGTPYRGTSYLDETAKWRAAYETSLKAPDGWLSVAGLFWLHEGDNILGSDAQSDVVLPAGGPKRAGVLHLGGGKVTFQNRILKSDISGPTADVVKIGGVSLTIIERGGKTGVRLRDPNAETRHEFTGCKWFPADAAWRVSAKWVAYPQPKNIAITNILGMTDEEVSPGYAEFTVQAKTIRLEPVVEDGGLFFIFKDATSGKTSYGAGRFLDSAMPKAGVVELDFNKAYNPPCAFTAFATCPLPPRQNMMALAIEAGEKELREALRFVLASRSPRRAELLRAAGFEFSVRVAEIDETPREGEPAREYVLRLAAEKARAITADDDEIVLGADTTVVLGSEIMGKPVDGSDAARMLRALSGERHEVVTGICLRRGVREVCDVAATAVWFAELSEGEIGDYVASGEPMDKAGAYGIQGLASRFIERIEGSYTNVVGLPVALTYWLLREFSRL